MTCKNCGAQLAPEEKFCGECGAPVIHQVVEEPVVQEEKNVCSNCGAQLEAKEKFCSECGTPVTQQVEEEPTDEEPEAQEQAESFETNTDTITKTENINNHSSNKSKKSFITICILSIALFCSIVTSIVIYQSQENELEIIDSKNFTIKGIYENQLQHLVQLYKNIYPELIVIKSWYITKHYDNTWCDNIYDFGFSTQAADLSKLDNATPSDIDVIIEQYEYDDKYNSKKISETKVDKSLIDFKHLYIKVNNIHIPYGRYSFIFRFLYHGKDIGWIRFAIGDINRLAYFEE